jgi:hypothetical protein
VAQVLKLLQQQHSQPPKPVDLIYVALLPAHVDKKHDFQQA